MLNADGEVSCIFFLSSMSSFTSTTAAVLQLPEGSVAIELYWNVVPRTCENFAMHVEEGGLNGCGIGCHRAATDGLLVCATSKASESFALRGSNGAISVEVPAAFVFEGASIAGETPSDVQGELSHSGAGLLTSVPGEGEGSFYITLAPHPSLDGVAVVFGRVSAGMGVLAATLRRCGGETAFIKSAQLVDLPRQTRPTL